MGDERYPRMVWQVRRHWEDAQRKTTADLERRDTEDFKGRRNRM
jgi:hypothetical protein